MYSMYMFMTLVQTYVCYFSNIYIHSSMFYNMNVVSQYHCVYFSGYTVEGILEKGREIEKKSRVLLYIKKKEERGVCSYGYSLFCVVILYLQICVLTYVPTYLV